MVKLVRLLTKMPEPVPSGVLESVIEGFRERLQQTPRTVIAPPPSEVILPPLVAVVPAFKVMAVVVIVARTGALVVNEISDPYAVPEVFVA